jgi:iron complex transport system substrate-binding protein
MSHARRRFNTARIVLAAIAAAWSIGAAGAAERRAFVDSAGREVTVTREVRRVYAAGGPASIILYTLAPEKLVGWSRELREEEKPFIAACCRDLPVLGQVTGRGGSGNVEALLLARPDVVIDYGSTAATFVSLADRVQRQSGIPYVLIDGKFDNIPRAYRLLGALLGETERAERLAAYAERSTAELDALLKTIPAGQRPRVYYGRRADGLETGLQGSINLEVLERVGATNVAAAAGSGGLTSVSLEQVLQWNPDVILALERNFYTSVLRDPLWRNIKAVRAGRVYLAPNLPFGWFDRPPSVNRLIGVKWLMHVLYPQAVGGELANDVREFYRLFYHVELEAPQLDALLRHATAGAKP